MPAHRHSANPDSVASQRLATQCDTPPRFQPSATASTCVPASTSLMCHAAVYRCSIQPRALGFTGLVAVSNIASMCVSVGLWLGPLERRITRSSSQGPMSHSRCIKGSFVRWCNWRWLPSFKLMLPSVLMCWIVCMSLTSSPWNYLLWMENPACPSLSLGRF
jgi:hypothetical protein